MGSIGSLGIEIESLLDCTRRPYLSLSILRQLRVYTSVTSNRNTLWRLYLWSVSQSRKSVDIIALCSVNENSKHSSVLEP